MNHLGALFAVCMQVVQCGTSLSLVQVTNLNVQLQLQKDTFKWVQVTVKTVPSETPHKLS
jgi:hypothetical protein